MKMTIGALSLLALMFTGLKFAGVIDWSWWLVLAPLLVGGILSFLIAVYYLVEEGIRP